MALRTKQVHSRQFFIFVNGLLALQSLDGKFPVCCGESKELLILQNCLKAPLNFPPSSIPS